MDVAHAVRKGVLLGVPFTRLIGFSWWAVQDLNLRPLACEASALPLS